MFETPQELLQQSYSQIIEFAPRFFVFVLILAVGWMLAALLSRLTKFLLNRIQAEDWAEKLGIERYLLRGGVRYTFTTLVFRAVYWLIVIFSFLVAFNHLGVPISEDFFGRVLEYIPKVLVSIFLFVVGMSAASVTYSALRAYLNNMNVSGAELIAKVAKFTVILLTIVVVMENLDIGGQVLLSTFLMAFGALSLAFGIAFGLAGRKIAGRILDRIFPL
ncbi:MAG: hypothetical protein R3B54_09995 [Bdellovibrionota bacterium]